MNCSQQRYSNSLVFTMSAHEHVTSFGQQLPNPPKCAFEMCTARANEHRGEINVCALQPFPVLSTLSIFNRCAFGHNAFEVYLSRSRALAERSNDERCIKGMWALICCIYLYGGWTVDLIFIPGPISYLLIKLPPFCQFWSWMRRSSVSQCFWVV